MKIDDLVATFYSAFDNRAGEPHIHMLRELFLPEALIIKNVDESCVTYDLDSFIAPRLALLTSGDVREFHEWEIDHETDVRATIAQRVSRYRKEWRAGERSYEGAGVKMLQFVRRDGRWHIASLLWDDEPTKIVER